VIDDDVVESIKLDKLSPQPKVFDPRIIDPNKSLQIWSSESVELANKGIREGYKLSFSPYLKTVHGATLRKANLPFAYTEDEKKAVKYSMEDILFFGNNFVKLKDEEKGWINIKLREYQENLLNRYAKNRFNLIMFPRQSGKTTTTIVKIAHFLTFNIDKDCVVIAQTDKIVEEILAKIKFAFENLPFFIQPGFVSFNDEGFVLDNGCRLKIGIASESVVQGFSLDFLYIDEFAYIKQSVVTKFWDNIYPALTNNPKSRCVITSTPNGRNKFYNLWVGAINKLNDFIAYRIYWYDVPGRDEKFKEQTIRNTSIEAWEMGFECSFDTQLKSIFSTKTQKYLRSIQLEHQNSWNKENHLLGYLMDFECISQEVVQYNTQTDFFIAGIDISEGLEQDESTIKIKKIEWDVVNKYLVYKSVLIFHSNTISVNELAKKTLDMSKCFGYNNLKITVENNEFGGEYFGQIDNLILNEPAKYGTINQEMFVKYKRKTTNSFERGIRWREFNKKFGVKAFSTLVSNRKMFEYHPLSIEQYLNFGRQKNDTYKANYGNDDLVMADISNSYFIDVNNIYTAAFLNFVKGELRLRMDDEPEDIKKRKLEAIKKENDKYRHGEWEERDHKKYVNLGQVETVMLYDVNGIYM
jgi:hypothetical protein